MEADSASDCESHIATTSTCDDPSVTVGKTCGQTTALVEEPIVTSSLRHKEDSTSTSSSDSIDMSRLDDTKSSESVRTVSNEKQQGKASVTCGYSVESILGPQYGSKSSRSPTVASLSGRNDGGYGSAWEPRPTCIVNVCRVVLCSEGNICCYFVKNICSLSEWWERYL